MSTIAKRSIHVLSVHVVFALCVFLLNTFFPTTQKGVPDNGIFILFPWLIFTLLATLKSFLQFVEKKTERLIPLLIHLGVLIMLVAGALLIGLEGMAEYFNV